MNAETKTTSAGKDAFHRVPNISINPVNPINPFPVEPTLQHSNTPTPHSSALTQFSQPAILEAIGPARLARFFNEFAPDLQAADLLAPASASESGDANYFHSVAALFS